MRIWRGLLPGLLGIGLYLAGSYACLLLAFRGIEAFRVELGGSDDTFRLGGASAWSRSYPDSGPYRIRRGERRMTHFLARAALEGAALRIPASVDSGELELLLRAHRYGQPGVVHVFAGGVRLESLLFERDTYPWDVHRLRVPQPLGQRPLRIDFRGEDLAERVDLPPGTIVALDWVEIRPVDPSSRFRPTARQWLLASLTPALVFGCLVFAGCRGWVSGAGAAAAFTLVALAHALSPAPAIAAVEHLWIVFPAGGLVWIALSRGFRVEPHRARRLSTAFSLVVLAHSTIIFFPNHQPPDLRPHLGQVERLKQFRLEQFWDFSSTTPVAGQDKPTTGFVRDYVAPYPPWTYFLTHALRQLLDNPRFWVEFFALAGAGVILVLTLALGRALSADPRAPLYAGALMALEVATWHHASRAHTPGVLGQVAFLAAVAYLVNRYEKLQERKTRVRLAILSLVACIAYPGAFIHWVIFLACFLAVEMIERRSLVPGRPTLGAIAAAAAGGLGSLAAFYHRFVLAAVLNFSHREAILAGEVFRPRAGFFFLRNQMRDTVSILRFGYPLWVLLALPALWRVRIGSSGAFARKIILSWAAAYAVHLVLKDPLFFPQLFLYVKEELMFAPLASILGGMTLSRLAGSGRAGKVLTAGILLACVLAQARDYLYNSDMVAAALARSE